MFCQSNSLLLRASRSFQGITLLMPLSTTFVKNTDVAEFDSSNRDSKLTEKSINSVTLLGRITNPVKRGTNDHPVVVFSLATNSQYSYSNGEVNQKTEWHRICLFKPQLMENSLKYAAKGQRVLVQGRLIYGEIKDNEGVIRQTSSIVADDIIYFK